MVFLKTHLVFANIDKAILELIGNYCQVTAIHKTLDEASSWSKELGGEKPDLILINCGEPYITQDKKKILLALKQISEIRENRPQSRIVLLFPEQLCTDTQAIIELLRLELYNFWFLGSFDELDLIDFIYTSRTLTDAEKYLKEAADAKKKEAADDNPGIMKTVNRIYQPYYVKSNIIAFFSEDDSQLNYGIAVLTAMELAECGFKVSLIETIADMPHLAGILSVPHPYFNTRHAVSMYAESNNDFIRNCLYNKDIYLKDKYSPGEEFFIEDYPSRLFFLPDGMREDNLSIQEMEKYWPDFIVELARILIFEKEFSFIVFICQGRDCFNDYIMKKVAYQKFITLNMLPGSLVYGLNERKKGKGMLHLIGERKLSYVSKQLADLDEDPLLYFPDCLSAEFLEFVYLKKKNRIGQETREFIKKILELLGVKNQIKQEGMGMLTGLKKILKQN